jgi:bifunctional non-homologous end joining protein LigD
MTREAGGVALPRYEPMLAVPWPSAFDDPDWWFEVKWDGFRVLVEVDGPEVRLRSRRGHDLAVSFPELVTGWPAGRYVVDGEIVVFDGEGRPDFAALQTRHNATGADARRRASALPASVVAFDMLHDDSPLVDLPVELRRERLVARIEGRAVTADPIREDGTALWAAVVERGLEGIVAKRAASRYRPGRRSPDWRKIAHRRRVRVVVGGFTVGEGGRSDTFGALQVGLWTDSSLRYVAAVGTGFDAPALRAIRETLDRIRRDGSPFAVDARPPVGTVWVEPVLVALVEFKTWTDAGRLRAPAFVGFTDDPPGEATWEAEGPPAS